MIFPVEIKNLHFTYPESKKSILNGIGLKINKDEVITIVGLSGCGKSTLCYCICGIIPHVFEGDMQGEVLIFGNSTKNMKLPAISTNVGIVFQDPDTQLFSPTVEDEIAFGPENLCVERNEIGSAQWRLAGELGGVGGAGEQFIFGRGISCVLPVAKRTHFKPHRVGRATRHPRSC